MAIVAIGTTEQIIYGLFGDQQHNEHCKGWRWHLYIADNEKRWQNVLAELDKMKKESRS